ncbi:MAG: hypothetical protein IKZ48_01965 [Prevotella sp.]|nr:hypothetical protein [Prevotella sp.]
MKAPKHLLALLVSMMLTVVAGIFASCSSEDNESYADVENLAEKIIGKWIVADINGQPVTTNNKKVYTIVSTSKAYMSASLNALSEAELWSDQLEADVTIYDNKMTLISHLDEHTTAVEEYNVTAINGSEFSANIKVNATVDGKVTLPAEGTIRFTKLTVDYRDAIIGAWEGHCTSENSVFDDGQEHRWEYHADGSYVYYIKNANGLWIAKDNHLSQYFVDGNLLCTRWQNIGESENREWWEIAISGETMNWTALRQNADGSTFTATFTMTKVQSPGGVVAVDLGLSSGTKWANMNVGASKPEDYGDYYAWGEVEPYYSSLDPLTWKEGKNGYDWASYKWANGDYDKLTKYCPKDLISFWDGAGTPDGKSVLDAEDDVAHVKLGDSWRMPTYDEWTELRTKCTWTWTIKNGINGRKVTGPNGNSIFLPAAGYRDGAELYDLGNYGLFWTSSLNTETPNRSWRGGFDAENVTGGISDRYRGRSVRPVQ